MSAIPCPACSAETPDGLLCGRCTSRARRDLETIARLWPALEDALTRQTRRGRSDGHSSDRTPLPLNTHASKVRGYVANQLAGWVELLDMGDAPAKGDPQVLALWLAKRAERIRTHEAADEAVDEFAYCRQRVWQAVDLPADRLYCGACETCGSDLMARPDAMTVVCRKCERAGVIQVPVNVGHARATMLAAVEDRRVTLDEALTALPSMYGVEIHRSTLRSWIERGRLLVSGGRVRVGDVLDLAHSVSRRGA